MYGDWLAAVFISSITFLYDVIVVVIITTVVIIAADVFVKIHE